MKNSVKNPKTLRVTRSSARDQAQTFRCDTCHENYDTEAGLEICLLNHRKEIKQEMSDDESLRDDVSQEPQSSDDDISVKIENDLSDEPHTDVSIKYESDASEEPQTDNEDEPLRQGANILIKDESDASEEPVTDNEDSLTKPAEVNCKCSVCSKRLKALPGSTCEFQCDMCSKKCLSKQHLLRHRQNEKLGLIGNCPYCKTFFEELLNHFKRKHPSKMKAYACNQCGRGYPLQIQLENHKKRHLKKTPFECTVCKLCFKDSWALSQHRNEHCPRVKKFKCDICSLKFHTKFDLKRHMPSHMSREKLKEIIKCNDCPKTFVSKNGLYCHTQTYHCTNKKEYKCAECDFVASIKINLIQHKLSHSEVRKAVCPQCKKGFKTYAMLRIHLKTHSDERNLKCPQCDKTFKINATLYAHIKFVHRKKENPRNCDQCDYVSYHGLSNLKRHKLQVHSNERKEACSKCKLTFKTKSGLKAHIDAKHLKILHKCSKCSFSSLHKSALGRHLKNIHSDQSE